MHFNAVNRKKPRNYNSFSNKLTMKEDVYYSEIYPSVIARY